MEYLYETHCHCAQGSRCARSTAGDLVRAYQAAGYAGLVLTDHFVTGNTAVDLSLPWDAQMRCYYDAYLEAKQVGDELDFDVLFGIEHACEGGEYLCFGIDLAFLLANPEIPSLSLEEFVHRAKAYGAVVLQAHPFRWAPADTPLRTDILDGVELYNAANSPQSNQAAAKSAFGICTSGGDIHSAEDARIGSAGILLPHRIKNAADLAAILRSGTYQLHMVTG